MSDASPPTTVSGAAVVSATRPGAGPGRFHSLDALRAFALLLGVFFHAAESFAPGVETYWAIADSSSSSALGLIRYACHSFRLELFFLIAGFFAHLVYHRRGQGAFIRDRLRRILVPLVVGWVVLYPLLVFLWLLGASVSGRLGAFGIPPELANTPLPLLVLGFFVSFEFVARFDLTHLWFLHQLLVLYGLALAGRAVWHRWLDPTGGWLAAVDRWFAARFGSRTNVLLFAALSVPALLMMESWDVDTPKSSLLPHLPTTLLFGFQFGVGWLLHRQSRLLENCGRGWWMPLLLGVLLAWPTEAGTRWLGGLGIPVATTPWVRWLHTVLYALMMWGLMLGFLGLFIRFCRSPSAGWRYLADSSYWVYLVHLPLVVWLQIVVARWDWPWIVKYPLILVVALPLLFLSYHFLVRNTFIGAQLNGHRHPPPSALPEERPARDP